MNESHDGSGISGFRFQTSDFTVRTFPDPEEYADEDGIVAICSDFSVERLLEAYSKGIFPWPHEGLNLWFSPDPRCILKPAEVRITDSMKRILRSGKFRITFDTSFQSVIKNCSSTPRPGQDGTWITPEIVEAYTALHAAGFAHSVEAWHGDELAGGLYGVSLGRAFFGESMFSRTSNASKACFITLCQLLEKWNFDFIDCQVPTDHLLTLGATAVTRRKFLSKLRRVLAHRPRIGRWTDE